MRKLLCGAAFAAALILVANAADTAKKKTSSAPPAAHKTTPAVRPATTKTAQPRTTAAKTPATKTPATRSATHTATTTHRTTSAVSRRPVTTWRNRQAAPTADRYREIQDALVAKGYLQPDEASGKWDQSSIDALKRFQAEQKLDSTGKIDSLSLIALGLGPKYDSAPPQKPADPPGGGQQ